MSRRFDEKIDATQQNNPFVWRVESVPQDYLRTVARMEETVAAIRAGQAPEQVWLLEHPALYTAGTSAKAQDLLNPRFPVYETGRGGQYTYHGPAQRIGYVMLDLQKRGNDLRGYVRNLEEWLIRTLADFGVKGERREGRVGIWVAMEPYGRRAGSECKIAAIGVRVRKGVTYHGVALNVAPDLSHYNGIVPCGIAEHGVTSLTDLGIKADMGDVDARLQARFEEVFLLDI